MIKRFLNSIMILSVIFTVAGGLVTSCKDYDDDINNLQKELNIQDQNLKSLSEKTETAIKGLETKIKALEEKDVELLKSIDDNKKEIAKNKTAITKNIEDISKNADGIADNASNIEDNKKEIAKNLEKIKANEEKIAKALIRIKANEDAIAILKTKVQALRSELDVIKTKDIPDLKKAIEKINQELDKLNTFVEEQGKKNEQFEKNISDLQAGLAKAATKEELQKAVADFTTKMTALDEKYNGLISTLKEDMNKKFEGIDNKFSAIDQKFTDQKADYEKQIGALRTEYKNALKNYPTKQELEKDLQAIRNSISTLAGRVSALETNSATKTELQNAITELKEGIIKTIQEDVSQLKTDVSNADLKADKIAASFSQEIRERITSVEYIPEYHVNGIPAAPFTYIAYKKWENVGKPGEKQVATSSFAQPNKTTIKFNMNPYSAAENADETIESIDIEWIKSSNVTKSAAGAMAVDPSTVPLKVAGYVITDDAILEVYLEPNNNFKDKGYGVKDKFYMFRVIVNQNINNNQTDFETPDSEAIIRSEYILLDNQNYKTLKLHSKIAKDKDEDFVGLKDILDPSTLIVKPESVLIQREYGKDNKRLELNQYVDIREVNYNPSTGVTDAVKNGKNYCTADDLKKYGLSIKYNILNSTEPSNIYHPKIERNTEPTALPGAPTKSSNFFAEYQYGHIESKHYLAPQKKNTIYTSIGLTPVVQILLMKGKDIIDVRYLPVKFIDSNKSVTLDPYVINNYDGKVSDFNVPIDFNKSVIPLLHKNFHDEDIFPGSYTLYTTYYIYGSRNGYKYTPTLYNVEDGAIADNVGTMSLNFDSSKRNFTGTWKAHIPSDTVVIKKAIQNGEDHAIIAVNNVLTPKISPIFGKTKFYITHKVRVNFKKVTLHNKAGYFSPYWKGELSNQNVTKEFLINPALITDAVLGKPHFETCQIKGNLLNGYQKDGSKVTNLAELASTACKKVRFEFDLDNFKEFSPRQARDMFTIEKKAGLQILKAKLLGNSEIAILTDDGVIQLAETPDYGKANSYGTTAAKLIFAQKSTIPVKLVANLFGDLKYTIDRFHVNFVKPLDIKFTKSELPSFEDFVANGCTVNVADVVTVKEAFGSAAGTVYENGVLNAALAPWYNVSQPTWDLANAKCNVKLKGSNYEISDEVNNSFSAVSSWFTLTLNSKQTELTFHNNHGVTLQKEIIIKIPVSVKSKWGYYEEDSSIMTVRAKLGKK